MVFPSILKYCASLLSRVPPQTGQVSGITSESDCCQLVFCDVATGQVLGSTDLEEEGYKVKPPSYDGAYCYGAAFSDDGKLFGFCALAKAPEDEQADRFQFYLIDAATFEKKHGAKWDLDSSPSYMVYGMHVANDTGDIFCAQYHYRFGGLVTFRLLQNSKGEWVRSYEPWKGSHKDNGIAEPRNFDYQRFELFNRARVQWSQDPNSTEVKKWLLFPFPITEINKGYGLVQNPGWD